MKDLSGLKDESETRYEAQEHERKKKSYANKDFSRKPYKIVKKRDREKEKDFYVSQENLTQTFDENLKTKRRNRSNRRSSSRLQDPSKMMSSAATFDSYGSPLHQKSYNVFNDGANRRSKSRSRRHRDRSPSTPKSLERIFNDEDIKAQLRSGSRYRIPKYNYFEDIENEDTTANKRLYKIDKKMSSKNDRRHRRHHSHYPEDEEKDLDLFPDFPMKHRDLASGEQLFHDYNNFLRRNMPSESSIAGSEYIDYKDSRDREPRARASHSHYPEHYHEDSRRARRKSRSERSYTPSVRDIDYTQIKSQPKLIEERNYYPKKSEKDYRHNEPSKRDSSTSPLDFNYERSFSKRSHRRSERSEKSERSERPERLKSISNAAVNTEFSFESDKSYKMDTLINQLEALREEVQKLHSAQTRLETRVTSSHSHSKSPPYEERSYRRDYKQEPAQVIYERQRSAEEQRYRETTPASVYASQERSAFEKVNKSPIPTKIPNHTYYTNVISSQQGQEVQKNPIKYGAQERTDSFIDYRAGDVGEIIQSGYTITEQPNSQLKNNETKTSTKIESPKTNTNKISKPVEEETKFQTIELQEAAKNEPVKEPQTIKIEIEKQEPIKIKVNKEEQSKVHEIPEKLPANEVTNQKNVLNNSLTSSYIPSPSARMYQSFVNILSRYGEKSIQSQTDPHLNILLADKVIRKQLKELHAKILENPEEYLRQLEELVSAKAQASCSEQTEEYERRKEVLEKEFKEIRKYYQYQEELSKRAASIIKNLHILSNLYITPQANMLNVTLNT